MDKLENFIKKRKEDFQYIEPNREDWENILKQLDEVQTPKIISFWQKIRSVAAIFLVITGCFFLFSKRDLKRQKPIGLQEEMYFPDISLKNPSGEEISVSDLKGKVVLVDFWASYCMMCTEDHCWYFKPIYDDYRDEGFEIYSVSVDSDIENWRQAIEKDSLNWIHVSDLMGVNSPVYAQYAVDELPTNYLLDEKGKIIARNIEASELEETLSSLLAFQPD